jgi:hypothetical protein
MKTIFKGLFLSLMLMFMVMDFSCSKQPTSAIDGTGTNPPKDTTTTPTSPAETDVSLWLTKADKSALFQKQNVSLIFSNTSGS